MDLPDMKTSFSSFHEVSMCVACKQCDENNRLGTFTQSVQCEWATASQPRIQLPFLHMQLANEIRVAGLLLVCEPTKISALNLSSSCVMATASSPVSSAFPFSLFSKCSCQSLPKNWLSCASNMWQPFCHLCWQTSCTVLSSSQAGRTRPLRGASVTPWHVCRLSSAHRALTHTRDLQLPLSREHPTFSALDNSSSNVTYFPKPSPALPGKQKQMGQALVILVFLELITVSNIGRACLRNWRRF